MKGKSRLGSQLLVGSLLILAGLALLLENQDVIDVGPIWRYWPLLVVGFGIAKLFRADTREEQGSGLWIFIIGLWFLVSVLRLWDLSFHETWPAVFIAFGVSMLWKSLPPMSSHDTEEGNAHGQ
jgi:hypothetical protein